MARVRLRHFESTARKTSPAGAATAALSNNGHKKSTRQLALPRLPVAATEHARCSVAGR